MTEPEEKDGFNVSVRTFDSLLKLKKQRAYRRTGTILMTVSSAVLIWAACMLILSMGGMAELFPFTLPGVALFVAASLADSKLKEKGKLLLAAVVAVAFVAVLIVLRKYIWSGYALIANQLYDYAEEAQSYVYNRIGVGSTGEESPELCMYIMVMWASCLFGFLAALPGLRHRRAANAAIVIVLAFVFAYFGIEPSIIYACVAGAALLVSAGNGRITSALPLLLLVAVLTAGMYAADPGQIGPVSRANEYLRDRFALSGVYLEGVEQQTEDPEAMENQENRGSGLIDILTGKDKGTGAYVVRFVLAALFTVLILAAVYFIYRGIDRKRRIIREGLDSDDPRTAVGAMFPYTVRWLGAGGIDTDNKSFSELVPELTENMGSEYTQRYEDMLGAWNEAVYSDHDVSEQTVDEMSDFMDDTVAMVKKSSGLMDRLRIRFGYAL